MFLKGGGFMSDIENIKINSINHKDLSLKRLNQSFEKHIALEEYKKSDILAYWINDFANKANLGFNVGR